jgi:hypothetical protein
MDLRLDRQAYGCSLQPRLYGTSICSDDDDHESPNPGLRWLELDFETIEL